MCLYCMFQYIFIHLVLWRPADRPIMSNLHILNEDFASESLIIP